MTRHRGIDCINRGWKLVLVYSRRCVFEFIQKKKNWLGRSLNSWLVILNFARNKLFMRGDCLINGFDGKEFMGRNCKRGPSTYRQSQITWPLMNNCNCIQRPRPRSKWPNGGGERKVNDVFKFTSALAGCGIALQIEQVSKVTMLIWGQGQRRLGNCRFTKNSQDPRE